MSAALLLCLVVVVSDGDTIKARCGEPGAYEQIKVRVAGIDAPEKKQAFGQRAKEAMSDLVFNRMVELECGKTDRYGRSVCNVRVQQQDAGLALVRRGYAWWYRAYSREQSVEDRGLYEAAEDSARTQHRGLWSDAAPVPPWEWRRRRKNNEPTLGS